jgi:hypothetical protein
MRTFKVLSLLVVSGLTILVVPEEARAVTATVPGSFSCTVSPCFGITNSSGGTAISVGSTSGDGIFVSSSGGIGVFAQTGDATAIVGDSTSDTQSGVRGVNTGSGNGVYGSAAAAHTGSAIFGDAGGSFTAWAGNYNGDVQARGFYNSSDARLKRDIKDVSSGLDQLLRLRPVTYKWKKDSSEGATQLGLIAQEVQKIFPVVVRKDATSGMLSINYTELLPVVIKAVQEQQQVIRQQEARISTLERQRSPATSSLLPVRLGGGVALALLPVGLFVGIRKRKDKDSV